MSRPHQRYLAIVLLAIVVVLTGCPGDPEDNVTGPFPTGVWQSAVSVDYARGTTILDRETETDIYWVAANWASGNSILERYQGSLTSGQSSEVGLDFHYILDSAIETKGAAPSSSNDIWMAAFDDGPDPDGSGYVYRSDGTGIVAATGWTASGTCLRAIEVVDDGADKVVVAVGDGGAVWMSVSGSGTWASSTITGVDLKGVFGTDIDHLWAVGEGGAIYKYNSGTGNWASAGNPYSADLYDIHGPDGNTFWVVGENRTIIKVTYSDGTGNYTFTPEAITGATGSQPLVGIHVVDGNNAIAVGGKPGWHEYLDPGSHGTTYYLTGYLGTGDPLVVTRTGAGTWDIEDVTNNLSNEISCYACFVGNTGNNLYFLTSRNNAETNLYRYRHN